MRCLTLIFLTALMTGCVTSSSVLNDSIAASLTQIHIVPIEGPPLSGRDLSGGLSGAELVAGATTTGSNALLLAGGILMLMEVPEANLRSAAASENIESLLDRHEIWEPTAEIAKETMRQLETASNFPVTASLDVKPLPGVKRREATLFMENWMAPLRAYYNMGSTPYNYSEQPSYGAVLEVGILNYELSAGYFLVQVTMKLVDPATGAVMANTRKFSNSKIGDPDRLFDDNAAAYKQLFRDTTKALVTECIDNLGLGKS